MNIERKCEEMVHTFCKFIKKSCIISLSMAFTNITPSSLYLKSPTIFMFWWYLLILFSRISKRRRSHTSGEGTAPMLLPSFRLYKWPLNLNSFLSSSFSIKVISSSLFGSGTVTSLVQCCECFWGRLEKFRNWFVGIHGGYATCNKPGIWFSM